MKYSPPFGHGRTQMRWSDFDYSSHAMYFITIVTQERLCLFGHVENGRMMLNAAGNMVMDVYQSIDCDSWYCHDVVVMPNHIHFLVSLHTKDDTSLFDVIRLFKSITTSRYCAGVLDRGWTPFRHRLWQRSYWDCIVWNQHQFDFIRRYIFLNPERWAYDAINDKHEKDVDDINGCIKRLR